MTEAPKRLHYAWVVALVSFFVLIAVAGVRSTAGVIIVPLEADTGWTVGTISVAVAINVMLYGLMGPFAAALMARFGTRNTVVCALGIMAVSCASTSLIRSPLQLYLTWGLGVGLGVGMVSMAFATMIATRWFHAKRGLVLGAMTGATATGQLIFLPSLAWLAERSGWRSVGLAVSLVAVVVAIPVMFFMRDHPESMGLRPFGAPPDEVIAPPSAGNPLGRAFGVLKRGLRNRDFLLVAGTFYVCGASTNGFIGTHFIKVCGDHGIPEVTAAGTLAFMGLFSLIGTTLAGWLSDRFAPGKLLFLFYGTRGLSLLILPFVIDRYGLPAISVFMVFFGLDWLATVGPNVRALTAALGKNDAPIAVGWIGVVHQMGAGTIALLAGIVRTNTLSYLGAFLFSGTLCLMAALLALAIGRGRKRAERSDNPTSVPSASPRPVLA
jgi:sugar phosphate permease